MHSSRVRGFYEQCHICSSEFFQKCDLYSHLINEHYFSLSSCSSCGKDYDTQDKCYRHFKTMHLQMTKYVCPICGHKAPNSGDLDGHLNMHKGIQPYNCPQCEKSFMNRRVLQRHVKEVHEKRFKHNCPTCKKGFDRILTLKMHLKRAKCKANSSIRSLKRGQTSLLSTPLPEPLQSVLSSSVADDILSAEDSHSSSSMCDEVKVDVEHNSTSYGDVVMNDSSDATVADLIVTENQVLYQLNFDLAWPIEFISMFCYCIYIYHRFIVRFPIGLDFLFITFLLQEC